MVDNPLGYRFTNEIYATKKEVQNILKVSMIDKYWTNIVDYRSSFTTKTGIKSIDNTYFSVCLAPSINDKINSIERKINKIYKKFHGSNNNSIKSEIAIKSMADCITTLADSLMIAVTPEEVNNLVNNNISAISPDKIILQKYAALLKDLYQRESISDLSATADYLFEIVSTLVPTFDESGSIYRNKPLYPQKVQYTNTYDEAPVRAIEPLMTDLFNFLRSSKQGFVLKMAASLFYIYYLKPFEAYNELISSLFSKYILLNDDLDPIASFINIESILAKDTKLNSVCNETQKACDLTYFLVYFCDKLDSKLDEILDRIVVAKGTEIKNEYYGFAPQNNSNSVVMSEEELKTTPNPNVELPKEKEITDIFAEIDDEQDENEAVSEDEPVKEEQIITDIASFESKGENEDPKESKPIKLIRNAAITNLTYAYNEEEARKVEQFILDSNPNLCRPQAYFYARHCTVGKFYTIAQYKKEVGCAYETARNAMDKLVKEGYYAKEPYKNKFLYTPIKKK